MGFLRKLFKPLNNKIKGAVGEHEVKSALNPIVFGKVNHRLINNLTIIDKMGKTHQIDHVEIRSNGIFCIETKNYSGLIYGDEIGQNWTQVLYKEKNYFLNPLKQNNSHVYQLIQILGPKYRVNSLVVMVKNNTERIESDRVINLKNLRKYLKNYNDGTNYSDEQIDDIYEKLVNANAKITTREHLTKIKETKKELQNGICPRCGGLLVVRNGKYGNFLGCCNYPKCRFTSKI